MNRRWRPSQQNPSMRMTSSSFFGIFLVGALFILICSFLLFWGFSTRYWGDQSEKNIVIVPENIDGFTGKIIFAHISPKSQKVSIALFPADYSVKVIGGYGEYPFRSIHPLLKLDKKEPQFFTSVFSLGLEKTVDEVWWSSQKGVFQNLEANDYTAKSVLWDLVMRRIHAQASFRDRVFLYSFLLRLRPDQIQVYEAATPGEWSKVQGSILFPSQAKECSISVINTTSTSGLGSLFARTLEKSGFSIVRVTDDSTNQEKTTLLASPQAVRACKDIIGHLQQTLPFEVKAESKDSTTTEYRSEIVLLLGKDVAHAVTAEK